LPGEARFRKHSAGAASYVFTHAADIVLRLLAVMETRDGRLGGDTDKTGNAA